jgi:hypothetical protein
MDIRAWIGPLVFGLVTYPAFACQMAAPGPNGSGSDSGRAPVVVESAKLAGFLLETSNRWDFQVLGIGINVRSSPPIPEYPTASVDQYSAGPVARAELAAAILNRFEEWYLHSTESELAKAYSHWTL